MQVVGMYADTQDLDSPNRLMPLYSPRHSIYFFVECRLPVRRSSAIKDQDV